MFVGVFAEIVYVLDDCVAGILLVDDHHMRLVGAIRERFRHRLQVIHVTDARALKDMLSFETLISESEPIEDAFRNGDEFASIM